MLSNRWYAIYDAGKLGRTKPVGLTRLGQKLVLWRDNSAKAHVALDRCPHRGTALSAGSITEDCLTCPYHGFRYDGDGACVHLPAAPESPIPSRLRLAKAATTEQHGLIWFWWGDREPDDLVPWLEKAPSHLSGRSASAEMIYPVHYSRVVESNFDLHHFPFVHRNLVRRVSPLVTDVEVETGADWITSTAHLGKGTKGGFRFDVDLRLPNVQRLRVGNRFDVVTVATPIDDNSTWMWARLEVIGIRGKLLARAASRLALNAEFRYIQFRQDVPVLESITPRTAQPGASTFISVDAATAQYATMRQNELKSQGRAEPRFSPSRLAPAQVQS